MFTTLIIVLINCSLFGQLEPIIGLEENKPRVWALTDAKVYLEPGISYENASIIIRDGLIETVGPSIKIPKDATIINMAGKIIYPGFIESWLKTPHFIDDSTNSGIHWNHKVFVRNKSQKVFNYTKNIKSKLHRLGFTAAHIVPDSGVYRGSSAISQLNLDATLLKDNIAQVIAYEVDGWGSEKFPNSLLGVVALIRQTMIDAQWYKTAVEKVEKYPNKNKPIETNIDLDILSQWLHRGDPFIFNTKHELDIFRSVDIANEFSFMPWFKGSGYEYRRVAHLKDMKPFIIVPLDFPVTPSYTENYEILNYTTAELKHWDKAPANPAILFENNIPFSLTSDGLTEKEFRKNLNRSINRSLDAEYALASLTTVPAQYFGVSNKLGKIKEGFIANLTITDGDYFDSNADVISVWIGGTEYPISNHYQQMLRGSWSFNYSNKTYNLKIILKNNTLIGKLSQGFSDFRLSKLQQNGSLITFQINWDSTSVVEKYSGYIIDNYIEGVSLKDGLKWSAEKNSGPENKFAQNKEFSPSNLEVFYPEGAYGRDRKSFGQQTVLVKNTTIWTCSKSGVLFNTDILFRDGKIKKIGKDLSKPAAAILIDGSEKHITPGLIDCHSHSAAFAINEGTQSITSEVRIQDVINSDDITIYRELAGGLTIANILHGSANTIGGQNAVIKLRWGSLPGNLLYENAAPGIKFALGENVKQSNWGDDHTTRYPQTRMGVEQLLRDAFKRAEKYKFIWQDYNENKRQ